MPVRMHADEVAIDESMVQRFDQSCAAPPYHLETHPLIVERSRHKLRALGIGVRDHP